jgi:hypothetical protein
MYTFIRNAIIFSVLEILYRIKQFFMLLLHDFDAVE